MQKKSENPRPQKHRVRKPLTHQVRIIGGQWKRTPLAVVDAEGLRPTPDRVRETVFNWLNHLFDGAWGRVSCLDMFAGTGALGFEAASRGAASVLMIESNSAVVRQLQETQEKLQATQVTILRGDAATTTPNLWKRFEDASKGDNRFQLIFLDPPYHQDLLAKMLPVCAGFLSSGGLVYVEAEQAFDNESLPEWMNGWQVIRADKAGMVFYHLLQRKEDA